MEGNGNIKIGQVVFYDGSHLSIKALLWYGSKC